MDDKRRQPSQQWIIICMQCSRVKRGDRWTDEIAAETNGKSTGYCDACTKALRGPRSH